MHVLLLPLYPLWGPIARGPVRLAQRTIYGAPIVAFPHVPFYLANPTGRNPAYVRITYGSPDDTGYEDRYNSKDD